MMGKLDEISRLIGALQATVENGEKNRIERAVELDRRFEKMDGKIDAVNDKVGVLEAKVDTVAVSIDGKVQKSVRNYIGGAVAGGGVVLLQRFLESLGLSFPPT